MNGTTCRHPVITLTSSATTFCEDLEPERVAEIIQMTPHLIFDARFDTMPLGMLAELRNVAQAAQAWWNGRFTGLLLVRLPEDAQERFGAFDPNGLLIPVPESAPCMRLLGSTTPRLAPCQLMSEWLFTGCVQEPVRDAGRGVVQ